MRSWASVLWMPLAGLVVLAAVAMAGPNAGGTLIVHYPGLAYTSDTGDYCGISPLSSCTSAVSEIDGSGPSAIKVWKVYAAFVGGSSPRLKGVSFGITYSGNVTIRAQEYGTCGDVEFPDNTWPRSGTGNSVIWDNAQTAILVECYWFAGYVTGGSGTFTLGPNSLLGGAFTDDSIPPKVDAIYAYGTMGFGTGGSDPCPVIAGACCFPDGTCITYTSGDCAIHGGSYQGDDTSCDPNPCPQPGACCINGACTITIPANCQGQWMGPNTTCSPNPCPQPGACCASDGSCTVTLQSACGGTWQGAGTTCTPNPCPQPGACCASDGSCTVTLQGACTGVWLGAGTTCSPNPCPQPGACCASDGTCTVTLQKSCTGVWQGANTTCTPNPCPQPPVGACCINGACTITTQASCQGQWMGANTVCNPNPCPPATGACCICGTCTMTTLAGCAGYWLGPSLTCSPNPCYQKARLKSRMLARNGAVARSVGQGHGRIKAGPQDNPCPGSDLLMNADGTYETAYAWVDAGQAVPYYGAFAEGYNAVGTVCGQQYALTTLTNLFPSPKIDAYLWNSDGCNPTSVINVDLGISISEPATWPAVSLVDINTTDEPVSGDFFVGVWGEWPGASCDWFMGADLNGIGGKPRTNIAPGIGYPTGWADPSIVWGPTQALGVSAYVLGSQPTSGACCFADGHCTVLNQSTCQHEGGTWQGSGTVCTPNPCPQPTGACCFKDGTCQVLTKANCTSQGGTYQGDNTSCTPNPCTQPAGACCFKDGTCQLLTQAACTQAGGTWQGVNTTCTPNPCPPAGACCINGACTITTEATCQGQWMGPNTVCNPNPCPPATGACCICGACTMTTLADCAGYWLGPSSTCSPNPCYQKARLTGRMLARGGKAARSVGKGVGRIKAGPRDNPCSGSNLFMNADGTYESAYVWSYGGEAAPYYGAFAEGYNATGTVCGQQYALTTASGMYNGQRLDAYLWNSDGCNPTSVTSVDLGISISAPGIWPTITLHDIDTSDEPVSGDFFVGYWGEWPGASAGWYVGADLNGIGGKPRTNIAPGIGYPTGWADPSIVWGQTQALGISVYVLSSQPTGGACCFADGHCTVLNQYTCQHEGGTWQGSGTVCTPNPCPQPPVGACCSNGFCTITTQANCPGQWMGANTTCNPNPCPPVGACCVTGPCTIQCTITTQADCPGQWMGAGTSCDPNPCPIAKRYTRGLSQAGRTARSVGVGHGKIKAGPRTNPCSGSTLLLNADGSYENGFTWWYGGQVAPYYGAFAEGYTATGFVCGQQWAITSETGMYSGQKADAYLWNSDGTNPTSVINVDYGMTVSTPAIWPSFTLADINTTDEVSPGNFFVGYWGEWPGAIAGWFIGADLNGYGGMPRTNIAPGIGYPTGWNNVCVIWGPTQAIGLGAYVMEGPPPPVPVSIQTWGRIKSLYH